MFIYFEVWHLAIRLQFILVFSPSDTAISTKVKTRIANNETRVIQSFSVIKRILKLYFFLAFT